MSADVFEVGASSISKPARASSEQSWVVCRLEGPGSLAAQNEINKEEDKGKHVAGQKGQDAGSLPDAVSALGTSAR